MLRFLLDEHLRGPLWSAIQRHNLLGGLPIDALRVGDPLDLPLGSEDHSILVWAEREGRILLTEDKHTMSAHLANHLNLGRTSPGVFILRSGCSLREIVECLELVAHAGEPSECANASTFIP